MTFRVIGDPAQVTNPARRQVLTLAAAGKTLAAISLEARRALYDTALLLAGLCDEGLLAVESVETGVDGDRPGRDDHDPAGGGGDAPAGRDASTPPSRPTSASSPSTG